MFAWQMMAILQRKCEEASHRYAEALPWLVSFGAFDNEEVRKNVIAGLNGAIVGAPADPEAFG